MHPMWQCVKTLNIGCEILSRQEYIRSSNESGIWGLVYWVKDIGHFSLT